MKLETALDRHVDFQTRELIKAKYSESHRKYHNLDHVRSVLSHVIGEEMCLIKAIIYHDLFYAPHPVPRGYNEAMSIAMFAAFDKDMNYTSVSRVVEMINASAHHVDDQRNISEETQRFLDYDLAGLAAEPSVFRANNDNLEAELAIIFAKWPALRRAQGRRLFLTAMMKREKLFYLRSDWEDRSRDNLENEIALIDQKIRALASN